jgi:FkbM family methyltransferase
MARRHTPRLDHLAEDETRRVVMTTSCRDCDGIAKVEHAGEVQQRAGVAVQIMHNGVVIEEGCYFGPWMTEIIRSLRGHHEPQEEVAFDALITRLHGSESPTMIEFGSFWAYYSIWFCSALDGARAVAMEPDSAYLQVGVRNAALNGVTEAMTFVSGAIGGAPGEQLDFLAQSDGATHRVMQHDLRSLMEEAGIEYADLVLADVQGAESILLDRARDEFAAGRVRFLVVSTHHHAISGDPLTHQRSLALLRDAGAHIIAEHSVSESFSGDGLIVASFDDRDKDFTVALSHARAKESLFGELEVDLDAAWRRADAAEGAARDLQQRLDETGRQLTEAERQGDRALAELAAIERTHLWRWSRGLRRLYARTRQRRGTLSRR